MNKSLFFFALAAVTLPFTVKTVTFFRRHGRAKNEKGGGWCKFREVLSLKSAARTESVSGTGRRIDLVTMRKPVRMHHGRLSKNIRIIWNASANTKGWLMYFS